ncbi:unnamed protein product [Peronospora belbahrii]|uniref:PLAC8 family protein n=1 Tax=Peronospora belbahrii TaxID=622444 RepID=A0AAU9LA69_9STRA|nr:unnamed protein product [Peronospora belbahrii]CAH0522047.1 unnamed protein product [Peronospora belbahrii]
MCILCSSEPLEDDVRKHNPDAFHVGMMHAPGADPMCCLGSCLCPCCAQIIIRRKALNYDMSNYTCCQGYMDGIVPCARSGSCGESSCPNGCLCLEAFCCNGCAVSATRMMVMDRYRLQPDKWDNRIMRCNNCIQLASCICSLLSICISELGDLAHILNCIAQCTYASTQGCMTAQVNVELREREKAFEVPDQTMDRV